MSSVDTAERHYVTFSSPGTFVSETTEKPIEAWDPKLAATIAKEIVERYGSRPFGFQFETWLVALLPAGPRRLERLRKSAFFYINGRLETLEEVDARNAPDERILRENMRGNGYKRVVRGASPWSWCYPFGDDDKIVDENGLEISGRPNA